MKTPCRCGDYGRRAGVHFALSMMVAGKTLSEEFTQKPDAASAAVKDQSHDQKHAAVKNGCELPLGIDFGIEELEDKDSGVLGKNRNACRKTIKNLWKDDPKRERVLKI